MTPHRERLIAGTSDRVRTSFDELTIQRIQNDTRLVRQLLSLPPQQVCQIPLETFTSVVLCASYTQLEPLPLYISQILPGIPDASRYSTSVTARSIQTSSDNPGASLYSASVTASSIQSRALNPRAPPFIPAAVTASNRTSNTAANTESPICFPFNRLPTELHIHVSEYVIEPDHDDSGMRSTIDPSHFSD